MYAVFSANLVFIEICMSRIAYVSLFTLLFISCNSPFNRSDKKRYLKNKITAGDIYMLEDGNRKAILTIKEVADNDFEFSISAQQYAFNDAAAGTALATDFTKAAYASMGFQLSFSFVNDGYIMIEQKGKTSVGKEKIFEGPYFKASSAWPLTDTATVSNTPDTAAATHLIFLSDILNDSIRSVTTNTYPSLVRSMKSFSIAQVSESYTDYKVYTSGVGEAQSSIICIRSGRFCIIGMLEANTVHLYSNDPKCKSEKDTLPQLMTDWINKVPHKTLLFHNK
jgi:hypothetical protein